MWIALSSLCNSIHSSLLSHRPFPAILAPYEQSWHPMIYVLPLSLDTLIGHSPTADSVLQIALVNALADDVKAHSPTLGKRFHTEQNAYSNHILSLHHVVLHSTLYKYQPVYQRAYAANPIVYALTQFLHHPVAHHEHLPY